MHALIEHQSYAEKMEKLVIENRHPVYACYDEDWTMYSERKKKDTILSSMLNTISKPIRLIASKDFRSTFTLSSYKNLLYFLTLILTLELTIFMIHNCWPDETICDPIQWPKSACGVGNIRYRAACLSLQEGIQVRKNAQLHLTYWSSQLAGRAL